MQLLDLSEDLLLRILAPLPFHQRLRLPLVCRKLRQLSAGPSELWHRVEASPVYPGENGPADAALREALASFRRWLAPRLPAVRDLHVALRALQPLPATPLSLPCDLLPYWEEGQPLPALETLTIEWAGAAYLRFEDPGGNFSTCYLRKLCFFGTQLGLRPTHLNAMPLLTDVGLIGGRLAPPVPTGPWLPHSVTAVCFADLALQQLPDCLSHIPKLRRYWY